MCSPGAFSNRIEHIGGLGLKQTISSLSRPLMSKVDIKLDGIYSGEKGGSHNSSIDSLDCGPCLHSGGTD